MPNATNRAIDKTRSSYGVVRLSNQNRCPFPLNLFYFPIPSVLSTINFFLRSLIPIRFAGRPNRSISLFHSLSNSLCLSFCGVFDRWVIRVNICTLVVLIVFLEIDVCVVCIVQYTLTHSESSNSSLWDFSFFEFDKIVETNRSRNVKIQNSITRVKRLKENCKMVEP